MQYDTQTSAVNYTQFTIPYKIQHPFFIDYSNLNEIHYNTVHSKYFISLEYSIAYSKVSQGIQIKKQILHKYFHVSVL